MQVGSQVLVQRPAAWVRMHRKPRSMNRLPCSGATLRHACRSLNSIRLAAVLEELKSGVAIRAVPKLFPQEVVVDSGDDFLTAAKGEKGSKAGSDTAELKRANDP